MSTPFDELRREIAQRHHVLVGADDPILLLVTANEFCVERSLQLIESAHAQALALQTQQLEHAAQRWLASARAASQETVDHGTAAIQTAASTAAAGAQEAVEASVRALVGPLRAAIIASLSGSVLALIACVLLWLR